MSGSAPRHRIVCCGGAFASQLTELQDRLGQDFAIEIMLPGMNPTDMRDRLDGALAVIAMALPAGLRLPQGIRLVQVPAAGWETLCPEQVPAGIPICNVGSHEIAVAEYCVTQMLAWRHRLREAEEDFRSGSWGRGRDGAAGTLALPDLSAKYESADVGNGVSPDPDRADLRQKAPASAGAFLLCRWPIPCAKSCAMD